MKVLLVILFTISIHLVVSRKDSVADSPVCPVEECDEDFAVEECSMWWGASGWLLAGKHYHRGDPIGWEDVVVEWTQHSNKAFPVWGRYYYFRRPEAESARTPYRYVFAPGLDAPWYCHGDLHNTIIDSETLRLTTDRAVGPGDPLFLPCQNPELAVTEPLDSIATLEEIKIGGKCLDRIATSRSNKDGKLGVFASKQTFQKGESIMAGAALHMDRTELYNVIDGSYEMLLNYCLGHPKSNLLLLPLMPMVNAIQHDSEKANVKIEWDMSPYEVHAIFNNSWAFRWEELSRLRLKYVALRDIQAGEQLYLDKGSDWDNKVDDRFRQEIYFDGFPTQWLETQTREPDIPAWATPKLRPGEVRQLALTSGDVITDYIDRVGLPDGFVDSISAWAERVGITSIMKHYLVPGNEPEKSEEKRFRINGGTWWLRRFDSSWESNLFCKFSWRCHTWPSCFEF